jgi:hypothetical protein
MSYPDMLSIAKTAERCKEEGIPLSEKALRRFVKEGSLPATHTGKKALIYFPNVLEFVKCGNKPCEQMENVGGIRRILA